MSDTTTTERELITGEPLTADDLAAIRLSTAYSLHTSGRLNVGNGSLLRLYTHAKGPSDAGVFSARQQILFPDSQTLRGTRARDILIDGSAVGYGYMDASVGWRWPNAWAITFGDGEHLPEPTPDAYFSGYDRDTWATLGRSLRVGSKLKVLWTASNNTEIAHKAALHLDSVKLQAVTGRHTDTWSLGWAASPDNSARMIRRARA